jgi:hypothetical protein
MKVALVSHVNGDGDLLEAWFQYYLRLGISSFHLVVHGSREENGALYALKDRFPVVIEDSYEGLFDSREKGERLNSLLTRMRGRWILVVDSDEFVEFPYQTIGMTVRVLQLLGRTALYAPMVQHLCLEGSLDTPPRIEDPFRLMPLCSIDLYGRMGVQAAIDKYPLIYCSDKTALRDGGNHSCPIGNKASSLRGVTHHFKFRNSVLQRLNARIQSSHPWRHESVGFQYYLDSSGRRLPTEGSFFYSRNELFQRGLLRKFTVLTGLLYLQRMIQRGRPGNSVFGPRA